MFIFSLIMRHVEYDAIRQINIDYIIIDYYRSDHSNASS